MVISDTLHLERPFLFLLYKADAQGDSREIRLSETAALLFSSGGCIRRFQGEGTASCPSVTVGMRSAMAKSDDRMREIRSEHNPKQPPGPK